jgi:hypothetical protein
MTAFEDRAAQAALGLRASVAGVEARSRVMPGRRRLVSAGVALAAAAVVVVIVVALAAGGGKPDRVASPSPAARTVADTVVDGFRRQDFGQVAATFDGATRAALPESKLRDVWRTVVAEGEDAKVVGDPVVVPSAGFVLYDFQLTSHHLQVAVGGDGKVVGLYVKPGPPTGRFGT